MTNATKKILIGAAAAIVLIIVFNILPNSVRIASTISAAVGFIAGVFAKIWYDRQKEKEE